MIAPPSAVTVSGAPAGLRSCFIGGDLSAFSATDPEGNGRINLEFYRNLIRYW
jgi:hypothetical protein